MTAVGLNPNTCLDCESLLEDDSPCGTTAMMQQRQQHRDPPVPEKMPANRYMGKNAWLMIDRSDKTNCRRSGPTIGFVCPCCKIG